jgi:radical SAM-linked protein
MTTPTKVRLRFAKRGDLRLVSHHDIMRCLERMLRRAAIPVAKSQGFNPRPKLTFASALGLGIEGRREIVDLELSTALEPAALLERLRAVAPPGFEWNDASSLPVDAPAPLLRAAEYFIPVPKERRDQARGDIQSFLCCSQWLFVRKRPKGESTFDLRPHVLGAELEPDGLLRFRLKVAADGSARPDELLEAVGLRDLLDHGAVLVRINVEL